MSSYHRNYVIWIMDVIISQKWCHMEHGCHHITEMISDWWHHITDIMSYGLWMSSYHRNYFICIMDVIISQTLRQIDVIISQKLFHMDYGCHNITEMTSPWCRNIREMSVELPSLREDPTHIWLFVKPRQSRFKKVA